MRTVVRLLGAALVAAALLMRLGPTPASVVAIAPSVQPAITAIAPADTTPLAPAQRLDPPPSRPTGETHVYLVGDSLTFGAVFFGELVPKLAAAGYQARVDDRVGRFMSGGTTLLQAEADAGRLEPVVLVALGSNEVADHWSAKYLNPAIDQLLAAAGDRWVIWVNVQQRDPTLATTFNALLAQKAHLYPHLLIAEWNAVNLSGLFDGPVHLTPTGYRVRADFVVATLNTLTQPH
jgi:hypothetical protein